MRLCQGLVTDLTCSDEPALRAAQYRYVMWVERQFGTNNRLIGDPDDTLGASLTPSSESLSDILCRDIVSTSATLNSSQA